jgi:hypothetical protein
MTCNHCKNRRHIMNEKVRAHLAAIAEKDGYDSKDDDILIEYITEGKTVWSGHKQKHRWWIEYDRVVEVEGMFIRFTDCETTGDNSPCDAGWEFDTSAIIEVKPVKRMAEVMEYVPV